MKGKIVGHGWSHYVKDGPQPIGGGHNREPQREKITLSSDAPYFRDGRLNRDAHSAPASKDVIPNESNYKRVDVYHHRADKDD